MVTEHNENYEQTVRDEYDPEISIVLSSIEKQHQILASLKKERAKKLAPLAVEALAKLHWQYDTDSGNFIYEENPGDQLIPREIYNKYSTDGETASYHSYMTLNPEEFDEDFEGPMQGNFIHLVFDDGTVHLRCGRDYSISGIFKWLRARGFKYIDAIEIEKVWAERQAAADTAKKVYDEIQLLLSSSQGPGADE